MSRMRACIWAGLVTWTVGIGTVLSFNIAADLTLFGKTFFDVLDYLTANIMLPLGGLCIAIFAGWVMNKETARQELSLKHAALFNTWLFLVKFVSPLAVLVVFLKAIEVI
jgi:Na+-dependent transporters of the SNF family